MELVQDAEANLVKSKKLKRDEDEAGNVPLTEESKANQTDVKEEKFEFSREPSLEALRQRAADFARERDWDQFHTPRNLLLALVGEVGELAEIFQWKGEVKGDEIKENWKPSEVEHLEQEMSDVFIYLMRLATVCKVDLPKAVEAKMALNAKKYPKEKCYGKNKKYNELN